MDPVGSGLGFQWSGWRGCDGRGFGGTAKDRREENGSAKFDENPPAGGGRLMSNKDCKKQKLGSRFVAVLFYEYWGGVLGKASASRMRASFLSHVTFIIATPLTGELTGSLPWQILKKCEHPQKGSVLGSRRGVLSMAAGSIAAEGPCSYCMNDFIKNESRRGPPG